MTGPDDDDARTVASEETRGEPLPGDRWVVGLGETGPAVRSFVGGFRLGRPRGGYEYLIGNRGAWAMLTVFREGVRLEASQMTFKSAVPTWEARYGELKEVAAVGTAPFRPGVRLYVSPASNGLMIFYTWGRRGLLKLLAAQGVHVRRKPVRFFYARLPKAAGSADETVGADS